MIVVGLFVVIIISASTIVMFSGTQPNPGDGNTTTTTNSTEVDYVLPSDMIYIKDAINSCFTGDGYSLYESGTSTLESTIIALKLLNILNLIDSEEFTEQLESINSSIASMHSSGGGFRPIPESRVDVVTTTLCIEILQLLGEYNDYYYERTYRYLSSYFRGSTYDGMFDDGVWNINYWGLKCAYLLGNTYIVGVRSISIEDDVYAFPNASEYRREPALIEGEIRYDGTYFWIQDLQTRMEIIEALSWTFENPEETTYLLNLLVRTSEVISELSPHYNVSSALFLDGGIESIAYSWEVYKIFDLCSQLETLDSGDWETILPQTLESYVDPVHEAMKIGTQLSEVLVCFGLNELHS